jgi:uncharacterized protein
MDKIRLNVLGISYSQTQTGAYALVLAEENGKRRIPIIIGGFEAQAIALQLEGLKPPRPITHDLFFTFAKEFNIQLLEVTINKLEEGVFHSKLLCKNDQQTIEFDTRTSDAIALALRFKCPIFTTPDILERAGIILDFEQSSASEDEEEDKEEASAHTEDTLSVKNLSQYEFSDLKRLLEEAIRDEDYEKASMIRDEMNRRKNS